jgi:5-oxoprolinase (ATP-hydrolysing)
MRKVLYRNNSYGTEKVNDKINVELCHSKQDYIHVYPGKSDVDLDGMDPS